MFGYIKPLTPELRIREHECYRAYYCGLCRAMGKCTGQCSRMTLSYDFVFLAAVRCWLAGEAPEFRKIRCPAHPVRRRRAVELSPQLAYCADVSALLGHHKCLDDLADERGMRRLRARCSGLLLSRAYRKARRRHPELDRAVARELDRLREFERQSTQASADVPAEIFGDLMKEIFADGLEGAQGRIAAGLGRAVGRWIYLVDAADDLTQDREKQRFNPYLRLLGDAPTPQDWDLVRTGLTAILCDAERAFLLMPQPPCPELKEIVANILYLGLPAVANAKVGAAGQTNKPCKTKKESIHE